jgi:GAF domain-containing protein
MKEVEEEYLTSIAQSDEHLQAFVELAPSSLMAVPLIVHGELLGALLLIRTSPSPSYGPRDLRLAEEVASRATMAVHNAACTGPLVAQPRRVMTCSESSHTISGIT